MGARAISSIIRNSFSKASQSLNEGITITSFLLFSSCFIVNRLALDDGYFCDSQFQADDVRENNPWE
jgi:hypothetical protein